MTRYSNPTDNDMGIATMMVFKETEKAYGCVLTSKAIEYFEADGPAKKKLQYWLPKSQLSQVEEDFNHELSTDEITFRAPVWLLEKNAIPYQND